MKLSVSSLAVAALLSCIGCHSTEKKNELQASADVPTELTEKEQTERNVWGTYIGTLPCADCGGKEMSLTISEDGTYHLEYRYLDTDEATMEENGVYHLINDTIVETVTPSSGEKNYYVQVHGNLMLSDSIGTINDGELADLYILERK